LRRINDASALGERDVPTRVETMLILGELPLLAQLTARQLGDLAGAAGWRTIRGGDLVIAAGEALDALLVVADGELAMGDRRFGRGQAVDELAWFAPGPVADAVIATRATRIIRIERLDFDELVDDVPGLAAAVCRVLGARARAAPTS
jgi:CRP-like cAMP-binding protein